MTLCSGGVSVGEGLLQTGLPPKEATQLSGPGKDGFSTSSAWGRDHETENGPIIGHTVSAFLWGENRKLREVLLPETLDFPRDWPWKIANIETILSPHPSLRHLPQIELWLRESIGKGKASLGFWWKVTQGRQCLNIKKIITDTTAVAEK